MRVVFGEILREKNLLMIFFLVIALFYILVIANAISRKVLYLVLEARNF